MNATLMLYLIYLLAFLGLLALAEGAYGLLAKLSISRKLTVSRRLGDPADSLQHREVNLLRETVLSPLPWLDRLLQRVPALRRRQALLEQAGLHTSVDQYLAMQALLALLALYALLRYTTLPPPLAALAAAACGLLLPAVHVKRRRRMRLQRFTTLLPDTMDYIARSLRAGNPFTAALKGAAAEMPDPVAAELTATFSEMNFGIDIEQALHNLNTRTGSEELRYFITAVLIQRNTGGNLAEVLTRIATIMRARAAMHREIQAISAEMHYSSKVLIALPFFMALVISVINPDYLHVLLDSHIGIAMIWAQVIFMLMGWWVIRQLINFRV